VVGPNERRTGQEKVSWPVRLEAIVFENLGIHEAGGAFSGIDCWNAGPGICGAKAGICGAYGAYGAGIRGAKEWRLPGRGLGAEGGGVLTGGAGGIAGTCGGGDGP
jgi:hypothetical protein